MTSPDQQGKIDKVSLAISRLLEVDTPYFHSHLNPEYSSEHLLLSQTPANLLFALVKARQAREHAFSWRHFDVGAAIMALKAKPSLMRFISGVNIKPEEDSDINVHAEQLALKKLETDNFDMVSMVAVVGEIQHDQQSKKTMHTLHPCGLCRAVLLASPLIDKERTLIVSAVPDFSVIEIATILGLQKYHEEDNASEITRYNFDHPLDILKPPEGTGAIHLVDTPQMQAEEEMWFNTVGIPLTIRMRSLLGQLAASKAD